MNTSAILDDPILDNNTTVLQPTQKFIDKSMQKIKDFWNWLLQYIPPKPKVFTKLSNRLKIVFKTAQQQRHFVPIGGVKICVEKVCDTVSNRWKRWV